LIERFSPNGWLGWITRQSPNRAMQKLEPDLKNSKALGFSAARGNEEVVIQIHWVDVPGSKPAPISKLSRTEQLNRLKALASVYTTRSHG
jgi:hypothetical protein